MASGLFLDTPFGTRFVIPDADARVGRPLTPISVAGVARRTARRRIRHTAVYVATLPRGCTTIIMDGVTMQQCGTTYYQSHGSQWVVVTVN
jgi:hypothetical protein